MNHRIFRLCTRFRALDAAAIHPLLGMAMGLQEVG